MTSLDRETCEDILSTRRRSDSSVCSTTRTIERALRGGFDVRVSIIAMEENAAQVPETIAYLRSMGVEMPGVSSMRMVGRGLAFDGPVSVGDAATDTHGGTRPRGPAPRMGKLCVMSDGGVSPCIFNRSDVLGRVPTQRLRDIVRRPAPSRARSLPLADVSSDHRNRLQCGSCRFTAYALSVCGSGH